MITWAVIYYLTKNEIHADPEVFDTTGMFDAFIIAIIMFGLYKIFG